MINTVRLDDHSCLGFVADVTQRKKMEQMLKESEARYRILFTSAIDAIFIKDTSFRYRHINKSTAHLFDLPADEIIDKTASDVFGEDLGTPIADIDKRVIRGEIFRGPEIITSSDGSRKYIDVVKNPLRNFSGRIVGICGIARDMTDVKALEEQLRHAQKAEAIGTLAGGIAHDFNNILGAIIGYSELALGETPPIDTEMPYYLSQILEAGYRAKSLVQQILQFSRPVSNDFSSFELKPVIKEVLELIKATLPATITARESVIVDKDIIHGDPSQIHQVIMNLVTNAQHAIRGRTGTITITLDNCTVTETRRFQTCEIPPGEYVRLAVSDTGDGIPDAIINRIFEPYFTTKEIADGTGLGLSVALGIVKNHHGLIEVVSTVGKGSTFSVLLPFSKHSCEAAGEYTVDMCHGHGEHVLLVDDERFFLDIMKRHLVNLGYRVTAQDSSTETLRLITEGPTDFDILVTDQTMPFMTGIQLAGRIRSHNSSIPIIICTGYSEAVSEHMLKLYGISKLLMKPLSLHELSESIHHILEERHTAQSWLT